MTYKSIKLGLGQSDLVFGLGPDQISLVGVCMHDYKSTCGGYDLCQ